jgi:mannose/cellobiose epimerase-like protein (N-acyl-D-glucosamine 2-epimerase family)
MISMMKEGHSPRLCCKRQAWLGTSLQTSRIVHVYALAYLMGRPGADVIVDHGIDSCGKVAATPSTEDAIGT